MDLHKPSFTSTPPMVNPGLQSRAPTGHLSDAGSLTSTAPMALMIGVSPVPSVGHHPLVGLLPHLTYPFQHAHCFFIPSLATCQSSLGISTPPSIVYQFLQQKISPSPGVLATMLNPDSGEIAFESMNPALLSHTLISLIKALALASKNG